MGILVLSFTLGACSLPKLAQSPDPLQTPDTFAVATVNNFPADTQNTGLLNWRQFFKDSNLIALIDTAFQHNQELSIILQEIAIERNDIQAKKGEYLPFVNIGAGAGVDKSGSYTRNGAVEHSLEVKPGTPFPDPVPDFLLNAQVSWELDIWKKLRNAKQAQVMRYLSSQEGKNFMVTNLVSEIASSYYELLSLDQQLKILKQNIAIQENALAIVRLQKMAGTVTELAVLRFEAEVLKNQSKQYIIQQEVYEAENRINFLVGRFPQTVARDSSSFQHSFTDSIHAGIPSQLLMNRPDIRQAEFDVAASKLDVKVAKAKFYPNLSIHAGTGYQAFNARYLFTSPQSLMYSAAGELMAPLINRKALKADYLNANSRQIKAVYNYQKAVLNGFIEVSNQLSNLNNLNRSYALKNKQVEALTKSISISSTLFKSAHADYMEVLLTQRDALEAKMELVELKKQQLQSVVRMYQVLGGGWTN